MFVASVDDIDETFLREKARSITLSVNGWTTKDRYASKFLRRLDSSSSTPSKPVAAHDARIVPDAPRPAARKRQEAVRLFSVVRRPGEGTTPTSGVIMTYLPH